MNPNPAALRRAPQRFRAAPARGVAEKGAVAREGGDQQAGLIRRMAVVTRGEALGHDLWIDGEFLDQTAEAINAAPQGLKARFTHPGLSSDGLGTFLGRVKNAAIEGGAVRADLHLSKTAHDAPDGDLAGYVMSLAENDPAAFGTSIVFQADFQAEREFAVAHGAVEKGEGLDFTEFVSPDGDNVKNFPHARLAALYADDVVDHPGANPDGLFGRGQEFAREADALLSYAVGLTDAPPPLMTAFDVDPDRAAQFLARFLDRHGLQIVPKEKVMSIDAAPVTEAPADPAEKPETKPAAPAADSPPVQEPSPEPATPAATAATGGVAGEPDPRADLRRYMAAFGVDRGATWYAEAKTFEEAQAAHCEALQAQVADLQARLAAVPRGAEKPVSFTAESTPQKGANNQKLEAAVGPNLARFAAGLKLPSEPSTN